jgi:ribosomal protein S18 acetylase RimI-like enzyme
MTVQVRAAEAADEEAATALWHAAGLVSGTKNPAADFHFARGQTSSDVLLGIDDDGTVVGSVMVGHDGHRGWLYYVASHPDRRGSGIGRRMVEAAEAWLQSRHIAKGQLLVLDTNAAVVAFYERLGFAISPRIVMSKTFPRS